MEGVHETDAAAEHEAESKDQDKTALAGSGRLHILFCTTLSMYSASSPWSAVSLVSVYYDDSETFGTLKKDQKHPLSNFSFQFVTKIVAAHSSSTGYIVDVTPERVGGDTTCSSDDEETICRRLV